MPQMKALPDLAAADKLVLVDVGGAGGLQEKWLDQAGRITPVLFEPNPDEARTLRNRLGQHYGDALVLETGLSNRIGEQAPQHRRLLGLFLRTTAGIGDALPLPHCAGL